MNWINSLLNRINTYQLMSYFLRVLIAASVLLSFFEILPYVWWHIALTWALLIVTASLINRVFGKILNVHPNKESAFITAEILTLIVGPFNPIDNWLFLLILVLVAMASKYLLVVRKRHIFNPAGLAVVVTALAMSQGASWWVGSVYLLPIVVLGGALVARKLRSWHLVLTFLGTYAILLAASGLAQGLEPLVILENLRITLIYTSAAFFAFVMLTEPLTAPARNSNRMVYGAFIAALLVVLQTNFVTIYYNLELALVAGNLLGFILSPNPKIKLWLKQKTYYARNGLLLKLEPESPIKYLPGQYLQYTLHHDKPDSRGTRRYFSIASSPTEDHLMLATKLAEKSSTFKRRLKDLPIDETLLAYSLDGEFVLPKNPDTKLALVAGGIGVAPFRSMIKYLIDTNQKRDIVLLYACNQADEFGFLDLFEEAKDKIGLQTIRVLSGKPASDWTGETGYITEALIRKTVKDYNSRTFYISGPDPMVRAVERTLQELNISRRRIKTDYFPGYD